MNLSSNHNNSSSDKMDESRDLPLSPDSSDGPLQIISASGGHIIAVANPALALSPALEVKREVISPSDLN